MTIPQFIFGAPGDEQAGSPQGPPIGRWAAVPPAGEDRMALWARALAGEVRSAPEIAAGQGLRDGEPLVVAKRHDGPPAHGGPSPTLPDAMTAAPYGPAVPLSRLRALARDTAHHREPDRPTPAADTGGLTGAGLESRAARALPDAARRLSTDTPPADARPEVLHALIAGCCDRLWVDAGHNGAPQAVLLDIGGWITGCTVELVRMAGGLRVDVRGVPAHRQAQLAESIAALQDELAAHLGCDVVAALARHGGPT